MTNKKRAFKSLAALVVWLLLPFVQLLEAADYYVSPSASNASDANSGTEALPWKTLNKANATLRAGDTVYLKAGTYTPPRTLVVSPFTKPLAEKPFTVCARPE